MAFIYSQLGQDSLIRIVDLPVFGRENEGALKAEVIKERFRDHDLRGKTGSDTDLQHAVELLGHADKKVTQDHYRRKPEKVRPAW